MEVLYLISGGRGLNAPQLKDQHRLRDNGTSLWLGTSAFRYLIFLHFCFFVCFSSSFFLFRTLLISPSFSASSSPSSPLSLLPPWLLPLSLPLSSSFSSIKFVLCNSKSTKSLILQIWDVEWRIWLSISHCHWNPYLYWSVGHAHSRSILSWDWRVQGVWWHPRGWNRSARRRMCLVLCSRFTFPAKGGYGVLNPMPTRL